MTDPARHRSSTIKPARIAIPQQSPRPTSPTPTQHTARLRAHLAHLLPRHAAFTVTVTVHQLHNVPLVHGEFALKWKIKGVTSPSGTGLLDKVKARKAKHAVYQRATSPTTAPGAVAKSSDTDNASLLDASDAHSVANSSSQSTDHANSPGASAHGHTTRAQPVPVPAVIVSANHPSPSPMARSISGASSIASLGSASSSAPNTRFIHGPPGYLSADWPRQVHAQSSTPTHDAETPPDNDPPAKLHYSPAKGITSFVKLKEHSVVWERTLKFVVQMGVGRDNRELGDCLAKFVVMQRVIAGDPDAPRNPRLGTVYLNLAQYVSAGVVTRRYLLRKSKTNATLKLTIQLERTAGELTYVAPPLPKDEILSGVAGILESSNIYRARPLASDLYTRDPSDSSSEDSGTASGSDASIVSGPAASYGGPNQTNGHGHAHARGHGCAAVKKQRRPFQVSKLPTINDPRGTEKLIEALFNPVPVMRPSQVTPFTYLVEVDGDGDGDGDADVDGNGNGGQGSFSRTTAYREEHGAPRGANEADGGSLYANSQDEGEGEADGVKSDYHSLRSHPSVQGSLRSKRSVRSLTSKVGLKRDEGGEATAASTSVQPRGGTTERRTWWQKVLSSPSASG